MRIYKIYLHEYITDILNSFGGLEAAVNKIVDAAMAGTISYESLPTAPDRAGIPRIDILIKNEDYISQCDALGRNNKNISLRRLIYYFVDNELFEELDWELSEKVQQAKDIKFIDALAKIMPAAQNLFKHAQGDNKVLAKNILEILKEISINAREQHIK